ncbi:DUF3081 domain-containing protein [Vibrio superstes]|uniref:DUF3081 domain-containing protein n=1 Tax=Vibrio superstes NBRC 103154 TaxID=1219062 RepID=A0A511QU98_9VIBR|nr:DUF3081 domain-containing protein [Vibrio superstes]GEM80386.1 hypothetical protein VSU01S_26310 [Vibrio superstes NBRC 103154]
MDNRLSVKDFLKVFDCIRSTGTKHDDQYRLAGLCAWHDYDGYTCWLGFKDVTVTLMFHGSLKIEYDKASSYAEFLNRCLALTASKPLQ